jgi:hypothetical protein
VLIEARLRHECGWTDARILNLSRRGLMVRAAQVPARGAYVEVCRGPHRIVARVVWVQGDRFGARTQDSIPLDAIAQGKDVVLPTPANLNNDRRARRREPGLEERRDRSRRWSRRLEKSAIAAAGVAAAVLAFDTVRQTLSRPLDMVAAILETGG